MNEFSIMPSPIRRTATSISRDSVEKEWTPELDFFNSGDLSVTYVVNIGRYIRQGSLISGFLFIQTNTFTHTTASNSFLVRNLPHIVREGNGIFRGCGYGHFTWHGITKPNYTSLDAHFIPTTNFFVLQMSGSAQPISDVVPADVPTLGPVALFGGFQYLAE